MVNKQGIVNGEYVNQTISELDFDELTKITDAAKNLNLVESF